MELKNDNKIKTIKPEPLVAMDEVMRVYGGKKTYWHKAKDLEGLPFYNIAGIKFRISEVERWVQQRKKVNFI